jgi:hypothetical protein
MIDHRVGPPIYLQGDGSQTQFFLGSTSLGLAAEPSKQNWVDETSPPARAARFAVDVRSQNGQPLAASPDPQAIVNSLGQLRSIQTNWVSDASPGATNVRIMPVHISGGDGKVALRIDGTRTS